MSTGRSASMDRVLNALIEPELRAQDEGLKRLLTHFSLLERLQQIADELCMPLDLRNHTISALAWQMVGPELAKGNAIYEGKRKGAKKKGLLEDIDYKRARLVEEVRGLLFDMGHEDVTDIKIVSYLQEHGHKDFRKMTNLPRLLNSVSQGKSKVRQLEEQFSRVIQSQLNVKDTQ